MGGHAGYNGCAALSGYLLQQKLKHSQSRFCLQHFFYHALHAAKQSLCYFFSAAAPIFAMARLCGAVPGKPASPGYIGPVQAGYNGLIAGRSLASVCLL